MREAIETMKKKWLVAGFLWGISLFLQAGDNSCSGNTESRNKASGSESY